MLTLLDLLNDAGGSLKECRPRMHKELVKIVLRMNEDGITARGIERSLKDIAKTQIEIKYSQSKYLSYSRDQLRRERELDERLLTLSTPRIIDVLKELIEEEKIVVKIVKAKNYHIYKLRDRIKEESPLWELQGLVAFHKLMTLPMKQDEEQNVEELVKRIGVFAMYVFLNVSKELGGEEDELTEEQLSKLRFVYVDSVLSPRFMYNKLLRFFIPRNQRSIAKADFDRLNSLMKKEYPKYYQTIVEGAREANNALLLNKNNKKNGPARRREIK